MYKQVDCCRICGNSNLQRVLELGDQALTGVFPKDVDEKIDKGPLNLVKCIGNADEVCGLLQLEHSYSLDAMYGDNYGYRSGLNANMVAHLQAKVERVLKSVDLLEGDLVIDIGSNDATTLKAYPEIGLRLLGIDPTGTKFRDYYPPHVDLIPDFFSADLVRGLVGERKAKVVTSFSMFYDLEAPMDFMKQVHEVLADDGIWVFEQSYLPSMLDTNSYDTVCHEHLEYYALKQITWMAERVGFIIADVEFNDVNGGSFSVTVRKSDVSAKESPEVAEILDQESATGLDGLRPFREFEDRIKRSRKEILQFVEQAKADGKKVAALGASTKGNVLLQYCGLTSDDIFAVGEVNQEKLGRFTPGSLIPIIDEADLLQQDPNYLFILPWHFRKFFEDAPQFSGRKLVFPLPQLEVVET